MISEKRHTLPDEQRLPIIWRWSPLSNQWAVPLIDNWSLRPLDEFCQGHYPYDHPEWQATPIPGHWQQHPGLEHHTGRVVYRCHFDLDTLRTSHPEFDTRDTTADTRFWLRINGAFYWSQPYFNGVDLDRHEGYFIPYEREVTHCIAHENTVLVEVECPDERNKFNKRMITGVFSHWDCIDPLANPGGIWLPPELCQSGPVRLHAVRCHSESFNTQFAQLRYAARLDALHAGPVVLRWTLAPLTFQGAVQVIEQRRLLKAGPQEIYGLLKLRDPRLWWTHDLGNPDLYTITLEVLQDGILSDAASFNFGVRHFELRNWIPYLNGVRFLVKGNNYAPSDMRIASTTAERCEYDLHLVRASHMNLLRVHAHVDHPAFYAAADTAGVLLWQDFPLQWLYRPTILPEARRQARAMVRLLYNHPSIVVWCMHNEPVFVGDTSDETLMTRLRTYHTTLGFSWNRDVLDTQLKQVAEHEDQQRPVIRSSGELYVPRLRAGTDAHTYFGWYRAYGTLHDAETLLQRFPTNLRFITEFGAQSFPNLESCQKFMPTDINAIDFEYLAQRHGFQAEIMSNWVNWRAVSSLQELIDLSQDYQTFINRFYIDRLRYHKYRPTGGIVPFLFCDPYPAILWSIVDYWRIPKRAYDAMRMAFSPQYVFTIFSPRIYHVAEPITLPIYAVNDARYAIPQAQVLARLTAPDGTELAVVMHTVELEADCLAKEVDRLRLTPAQPGQYMLELKLTGVPHEVWQAYTIDVT